MNERYISIKEVFRVIWSGKVLTLICAAIVALLVLVGGVIYENSVTTVSTVVALEWNGLTDGEYPDGSQFDYHDMFESYVINSAGNTLGVSAETIRENLTISPVLENDVLAIVQNALENGETIAYYASEYVIQIDVGRAGITVEEGKTFLSSLISEYRTDFEKKYVQAASVLDFTDADYSELDYLEIQTIFKSQLDVIRTEMTSIIEKTGNYDAGEIGYSFNDILVREELLRKTQYSNFSAKLSSNMLTKDLDELLSNLLYQKEELEYDLAIATAKRDMIASLIANYEGNTSTVIIPGSTEDSNIEIDTYYKELLQEQINSEVTVTTVTTDIERIDTLMDRYQGLDPEYSVDPEDQLKAKTKVDAMIPSLDRQLNTLVTDTNAVLLEYNAYLISGQITPLMAPQQERNASLVVLTAVGFVIGVVTGVAITLYKHEWE